MKLHQRSYKILIVDSSLLIVERLCILLTDIGSPNAVSKAFTYAEAVDKLNRESFDVAVFDTQLTGKDGFELLAFIKRNYPETKTIILTNQTSTVYRNKGEKMGADYFIDKSGEFEKLVEIIKNYAPGYQMN